MKNAFKNCTEAFWCSINDIRTYLPYYILAYCYSFTGQKLQALGLLYMAKILGGEQPDVERLSGQIMQSFAVSKDII